MRSIYLAAGNVLLVEKPIQGRIAWLQAIKHRPGGIQARAAAADQIAAALRPEDTSYYIIINVHLTIRYVEIQTSKNIPLDWPLRRLGPSFRAMGPLRPAFTIATHAASRQNPPRNWLSSPQGHCRADVRALTPRWRSAALAWPTRGGGVVTNRPWELQSARRRGRALRPAAGDPCRSGPKPQAGAQPSNRRKAPRGAPQGIGDYDSQSRATPQRSTWPPNWMPALTRPTRR